MEDENNYSDPDIYNTSTEIYYYDPYINETYFNSYQSSSSYIRLCIFLITSVCVGLPALVWACRLLHLHIKIRNRISAFIIILLLGDLTQLLLNIYIVTQLLTQLYWNLTVISQVWSGLHWCGFQLHQLVALEGVLTLKYPLFSARIFSHQCCTIISILVFVFSVQSAFIFFMDPFVNMNTLLFNIGTSLASLCLLALTFTITCKASSTAVSKNTHSVFTVAIFTFVLLYLPFLLFICVNFFTGEVPISWYMMCVCLMSLRVISDPLLCVLVCRENLRDVQTPQTHTVTQNPEETSVS